MRALILLALIGAALCDDTCFEPTKNYFQCARDAHEKHFEDKRETMRGIFDRMKSECLKDCDTSELEFPNEEDHENHFSTIITDEQKSCLRNQMWEHKLNEVQDCATDAPEFVFRALREISKPEKARFMHAMRHMKMLVKKTMKQCTKGNREARKDIYKCMMELKKEKQQHKDQMCEVNQECVDSSFADAPDCLDQILENKDQQCQCYEDNIGKPASKFIGLMKKRRNWSEDQKKRVVEELSPHFEACDIDIDTVIEQLSAPEGGRYRRHARRQAEDNDNDEDDSSSEEGSNSHGRGSGSHGRGSGSHERGGRKEKNGPMMCMCDIKPIAAEEVADDAEAAVASLFL